MQRARLATLTLALLALPAYAGVGKVDSPEVTKGLLKMDYSAVRYGDSDGSKTNEQKHGFEFDYGFTDRFSFGLQADIVREPGSGSTFNTYGIEAQYEMTQQGDYWLSSALKSEYSRAFHKGDADDISLELIGTRGWGPAKVKANLELSREFGSNRSSGMGVSSAMQAAYKINNYFTPGLEWHADYGTVHDFGENDGHYVGPVVLGAISGLGTGEFQYAVGYFWGAAGDTTDQAARLELKYNIPL